MNHCEDEAGKVVSLCSAILNLLLLMSTEKLQELTMLFILKVTETFCTFMSPAEQLRPQSQNLLIKDRRNSPQNSWW